MPIDASIYSQLQTPDLVGSYQKGLQMRDMMDQRNEANAIKDAFKKNTSTAEDGTTSINRPLLLKDLYAASPEKAMQYEDKMNQADASKFKMQQERLGMIANLAGSVTDQPSWNQARQTAVKMGLAKPEELPEVYDPKFVDTQKGMALTQLQRLELAYKDKELESRALDRKEARDERRFQAGIKIDEKRQGLKTPFGLANTEDDAKQLKEAFESKRTFDDKINQMIALREKHGGGAILNREDVERGKQLSKDLLLEYKNMAKLGVLSKSDEDIINAIIPPDPLQYNSPIAALQGQDPTLHRLKQFKADSDHDFSTRVGTRTRAGVDAIASQGDRAPGPQLSSPKAGEVHDGYVFMGGDPSNRASWKKASNIAARKKD